MVGCHSIILMASIRQPSDTAPVQLLLGETEKAGDCPLDIIIDLMVRASEGERRGGEGSTQAEEGRYGGPGRLMTG